MKIGILTVSHKRSRIDKCFCLMFDRLQASYPGLFLCVIAVSIEEEMKVFTDHGIEAYLYKNNPVGEKHNYVLKMLEGRCSHVLHLGSDDIIDNNFMNALIKGAEKDIVWGQGLVFYSVQDKKARFWDQPFRNVAGPAKLMRSELLDRVNWHIWDDAINKGLDHSCFLTMEPLISSKLVFQSNKVGGLLLDIKSEVNINPYHKFAKIGREVGLEYIYKRLSTPEVEYLKSLN